MKNRANSSGAVHKIGAVSNLSGVPTPTLRVWESRYGTFTPQKSQALLLSAAQALLLVSFCWQAKTSFCLHPKPSFGLQPKPSFCC